MSFMDKMKQKAEEFDLENKAKKLQEAAAAATHQAREKAGQLATDNRDKIDGAIGKASSAIDERTDGKYSDKIAKAKDQINKGVDTVAHGDQSDHAASTEHTGAASDSPIPSPTGPGSVNPPEVSEPQAGHPAPGAVPGAVPAPLPTPPKTPGPTAT